MSFMFRPPLWKVLLYKVVYNQPIIIVLGDTISIPVHSFHHWPLREGELFHETAYGKGSLLEF